MVWMKFTKIFVLALIFGQINQCFAAKDPREAQKQMAKALDEGPHYAAPQNREPKWQPPQFSQIPPPMSSSRLKVTSTVTYGQPTQTVGDVNSMIRSIKSHQVPLPLPSRPAPQTLSATLPRYKAPQNPEIPETTLTRSMSTPEPSFVVSPSPTAIIERLSAPSTDLLQPPFDQASRPRSTMSAVRLAQRTETLRQASSPQVTEVPLTTDSLRQLDKLMGSPAPKDKNDDWQSLPGAVPADLRALDRQADDLAAMHSVVQLDPKTEFESAPRHFLSKGAIGNNDLANSTAVVEKLQRQFLALEPINPLSDNQLTGMLKQAESDQLKKRIERATLSANFYRARDNEDYEGMDFYSKELKTFDGENPNIQKTTDGFTPFY